MMSLPAVLWNMPVCFFARILYRCLTTDNDWAASIVAEHVGADEEAVLLRARAKNYRNIWNVKTGFMEAKNSDGSWAGPKSGWTEGDHWAYSLTVMVCCHRFISTDISTMYQD